MCIMTELIYSLLWLFFNSILYIVVEYFYILFL